MVLLNADGSSSQTGNSIILSSNNAWYALFVQQLLLIINADKVAIRIFIESVKVLRIVLMSREQSTFEGLYNIYIRNTFVPIMNRNQRLYEKSLAIL